MSTNSRKQKFKLVTLSSSEGQSETTKTTEVKTKTEWTKYIFSQNDKSEKVITPTEYNKQGTSKSTFNVLKKIFESFKKQGSMM